MSMRGRESRSGASSSSDLLVCFPSRAHLTLMPKAICSPARANHKHGHSLSLGSFSYKNNDKRSSTRGGKGRQGSPLMWAKTKPNMGVEMEEPTSPKVTCAGQIRVRPKAAGGSCKNWQSVMEEIERIHKRRLKKKKPSWMEALGFKKEVMQFLTCLRSLRLDFRCFGSLPAGADITSDEDEEEEEEEEGRVDEDDESSRTVFSKWFMVLQENQSKGFSNMKEKEKIQHDVDQGEEEEACVPPPNALLLMRCRSAPAKSWLEEKEERNNEHENKDDEDEDHEEEDEEKKKEKLVLMRYDTEYYKISGDIAKETWVVGGSMGDALSRSRSWKR